MGITGLLPFLKNSSRSANIRDFEGATVAIDAYSWLHKGAFACAEKLAKGEKTDGYVFYCLKLLNMLLDAGVKPIMVFDGCNLRSKEITEKKRRENREKTKQRGKELLCEGKIKEARECFQRCVDVTPEMAREVIEACRKKSIDCIVAPYEADAQLAYLDKIGMAHIIITEDSDLILFGCNKILFKMDCFGGGLLYEKENLLKSFGGKANRYSFEKFRYMCILSGCDYLPSLPGIGLGKACKFFSLTDNIELSSVLYKLPSYLKMPKLVVSDEYVESFIKANNTFLYQLVFSPQKRALVPLNSYPEDLNVSELEYAGKYLPADLAYQLAIGNINVKTLKEFDNASSKNCPNVTESKSVVWGTKILDNKVKSSHKTESTAFKFSASKVKVNLPFKRKHEETDQAHESKNDVEDLLSMYGDQNNSHRSMIDDEDPIFSPPEKKQKSSPGKTAAISSSVCKNISNLPLHRIVRSRFFRTESKLIGSPEISNGPEISPQENIKGADDNINDNSFEESDDVLTKEEKPILSSSDCVLSFDLASISPKKNSKENLIHRFSKKKLAEFKFSKVITDLGCAITNSIAAKPKESWLDIIDNECSVSTSTLSSVCKAEKLLSGNAKNIPGMSVCQVRDHSKKIKLKKLKLISTKLLDYKWSKDSNLKTELNKSSSSDGNSSYESVPENEGIDSVNENIELQVSHSSHSDNDVSEITLNSEEYDGSKQHVNGAQDTSALSITSMSHNSLEEIESTILNETIISTRHSVSSDMDSGIELVPDNEDVEVMIVEPDVSPYFQSSSNYMRNSLGHKLSNISVEPVSDAEDLDISEIYIKIVPQSLKKKSDSTSPRTSVSTVKSSSKCLSKPGKCRSMGLSKNKKSSGCKVPRKETLLNFNFTRKPKK